MNLNDINNLSVVELSPSLPFDDVETASFKHKKLCNEGVAEVNIYESDINLIKDLKLFFAGYLKLLYIELFEGESKDDLIKAYSNIISSYKVKFEMLEVRQVIENITVYLDSSCHYDDLQLKLRQSTYRKHK